MSMFGIVQLLLYLVSVHCSLPHDQFYTPGTCGVVYFYHVIKTGGTSLDWWLRNYGTEEDDSLHLFGNVNISVGLAAIDRVAAQKDVGR